MRFTILFIILMAVCSAYAASPGAGVSSPRALAEGRELSPSLLYDNNDGASAPEEDKIEWRKVAKWAGRALCAAGSSAALFLALYYDKQATHHHESELRAWVLYTQAVVGADTYYTQYQYWQNATGHDRRARNWCLGFTGLGLSLGGVTFYFD
jgi:hypothetical protein